MLNQIWNFIESLSHKIVFSLAGFIGVKIEEEKWQALMQFVKFGMVGASNTILTIVLYTLLVAIGIHYQVSYFLGYLAGIVNAFYWNNKYVFKQKSEQERSILQAFVKCAMSYIGGYLFSTLLLTLWVSILHFPKFIGPAISLVVTIPLNFVLNKKWAFKI
ncbi:putative flippase GtrA [Lachnotalea glycerini]|jgi:putative flippase GtrA|nr:GtrA family protein [Lachnotalea glycerini]PXV91484.1 putative flippase GtrA [Lachnotalea glycerini]